MGIELLAKLKEAVEKVDGVQVGPSKNRMTCALNCLYIINQKEVTAYQHPNDWKLQDAV